MKKIEKICLENNLTFVKVDNLYRVSFRKGECHKTFRLFRRQGFSARVFKDFLEIF